MNDNNVFINDNTDDGVLLSNLFIPAAKLNAAGTKCDLEITGVFS